MRNLRPVRTNEELEVLVGHKEQLDILDKMYTNDLFGTLERPEGIVSYVESLGNDKSKHLGVTVINGINVPTEKIIQGISYLGSNGMSILNNEEKALLAAVHHSSFDDNQIENLKIGLGLEEEQGLTLGGNSDDTGGVIS